LNKKAYINGSKTFREHAHVEDPWDGDRPRAKVRSATSGYTERLFWLALLALISLVLVSSVHGQKPQRFHLFDDEEDTGVYSLGLEAKLLTEDYLRLLGDLRALTTEFRYSFDRLESKQAKAYVRALEDYYRVISDSSAYQDYEHVMDELESLRDQLADMDDSVLEDESAAEENAEIMEELRYNLSEYKEELDEVRREIDQLEAEAESDDDWDGIADEVFHLQESADALKRYIRNTRRKIKLMEKMSPQTRSNTKARMLSKTLQQELEVIYEYLKDEVEDRLSEDTDLMGLIDKFTKMAISVAEAQARADLEKYIVFVNEKGDKYRIKVRAIEGQDDVWIVLPDSSSEMVIEIPQAPALPELGELPELPELPPMPEFPRQDDIKPLVDLRVSENQFYREIYDTLAVSSSDVPIYIVNPSGRLRVIGSNSKKVIAQCEYQIHAPSQRRAEKLAQSIGLHMLPRDKAIYVEIKLPKISDPHSHIVQGEIEVQAPRGNPLIVKNSFGSVDVSDFDQGLRLVGRNSQVRVDDIKGDVEVNNKSGTVLVTGVRGQLEVQSANGPLTFIDCHADIEIENDYSSILLDACAGSAEIRNNGTIRVSDFKGDLILDNSNGAVEIIEHAGDLVVSNVYQPLVVEQVTGEVKLVNRHGMVKVSDIRGPLEIENAHSDIVGRSLSGPMVVNAEHGTVALRVDEPFSGYSSIAVEHGVLDLSYSKHTDFHMLLSMTECDVSVAQGVHLWEEKGMQRGEVKVGAPASKVNVTANGSTIFVRRAN